MWWFSTAVVDSYIWGMAIIVLFHYYMKNLNWNVKKKIAIAIGMLISVPAFAFALYPAYQVPLAFVVVIFMLNDIIKQGKELKKQDYIIMGLTLIGIVGILAYFVWNAWTDIQVMMNTVYPGERFDVGGDYTIDRFVSLFTNIFLPYGNKIDNPCEISGYIYPITGLLILIVNYFTGNKQKEKKEGSNKFLEIALLVLYTVLFTWIFIGFNKFFAQITFLYFSPSQRAKLVLELVGILLIFMLLKRGETKSIVNKKQGIVISAIVLLIVMVLIKNSTYRAFFTEIKLEVLFFMLFVLTYTLIRTNKKAFCYSMCIVAILAGAAINPIASGTDIFYKTNVAKQIQEIYQSDKEALWLGRYNWSGQYLAANGVNILNGVNIYPNFDWLTIVDPEGKYNEVYNRYAHIGIILSDKTEFTLLTQDSYEVRLTYQNIKDLKVKYYFTDTKLSEQIQKEFHTEVKFENQEKNQYIYQFN